MKSINIPEYEGKTLILVNVVNFGDRPTTITHLAFSCYHNWWSAQIKRTGEKSFFVPTPNPRQKMPFELKQGTSWTGQIIQTEDIEKMAKEGYLACYIFHTHSKRPIRSRVVIRPDILQKVEG